MKQHDIPAQLDQQAHLSRIGVGTVQYHVNNILSKLNVSCRTEAASVAKRSLVSSF